MRIETTSRWTRRTTPGRTRGRAALGLILAAGLMVPAGLALADEVTKQTPPPPEVTKTTPPAPAAPDRADGEAPASEAGSDSEAAAVPGQSQEAEGEAPLTDELTQENAQGEKALPDDPAAGQPEPGSTPSAQEFRAQTKGEPATSSAQPVTQPGDSLTALSRDGLDQQGSQAKGKDPDGAGAASATASGVIALKGEKDAKKADWVIVGLTAPLSTAAHAVNVVGASWDAPAKGVTIRVELREQIRGTWGPWQGLDLEDKESGAPAGGRQASEPYVSVAASDLQVRLLTSDGSVPKGARVQLIGDNVKAADKTAASSGKPAAAVSQASAAGDAQAPAIAQAALTQPAPQADPSGDGIVSADTGAPASGTDAAAGGEDDADVVQAAGAAVPQPVIRSRSAWGARAPKDDWEYGRVNGMVIHHTAGSNNYSSAQVPAILRSIQQYHMRTNGWNDIGYNFLIDKFGTIWEGRAGGIRNAIIGAQALNVNSKTSGVSVIGDYSSAPPSSAAIKSLTKLITWKLSLTSVNPRGTMVNLGKRTPTIIGHRDAPGNSTACPGKAFYALIPSIRSAVATRMPSSFTVRGSGMGNGVGLSQYGAYGMAKQGKGATSILQQYFYPAKVAFVTSNPAVKVQLLKSRRMITVQRQSGTMVLIAGKSRVSAKKISFKYRSGRILAVVGKKTYRAPGNAFQVRWSGTSYMKGKAGVVSVTRAAANTSTVRYRYGRLLITKIDGSMNVVNQLRLNNEYLYGVAEVPSSWPRAAMMAQAVASRTLAMKSYYDLKGKVRRDCNCQLYDEARTNARPNSQVFRGWSKGGQKTWGAKWRSAVNGSAKFKGSVVKSASVMKMGGLINVRWTPSTGGITTPAKDVFGTAVPYLGARPDAASKTGANPYRSWGRSLSPTQVARLFGLRSVSRVDVVSKSSSGAVLGLQATAPDGKTARIWGAENIRAKFSLPSAYFTISG